LLTASGLQRPAAGTKIDESISQVFTEHFHNDYSSPSDEEPEEVEGKTTELPRPDDYRLTEDQLALVKAHKKHGNNVSAIERELKKNKIKFSRRTISKNLDMLGLRKK
jgi:hypothetical protein